jgi:hypothetical protein
MFNRLGIMYTFYYLYHRKLGEILEIYEKSIKLVGCGI